MIQHQVNIIVSYEFRHWVTIVMLSYIAMLTNMSLIFIQFQEFIDRRTFTPMIFISAEQKLEQFD